MALYLYTGIDPGPLAACHTCDWPPCCRDEHIFAGTVLANIEDRDRKGRAASGDRSGPRLHPERLARGDKSYAHLHPETRQGIRNGRATLTEDQVREIRRRHALGGVSYAELGSEFHLTKENISMIVRCLTWKYVK